MSASPSAVQDAVVAPPTDASASALSAPPLATHGDIPPEAEGVVVPCRYCCPKCRMELFRTADITAHDADVSSAGHKAFKGKRGLMAAAGTVCSSFFLDNVSLPWLQEASSKPEVASAPQPVDLACPKCGTRLGSQCWVGDQCSCGAWVAPSFKVQKSRVDEFAQ